MLQAAGSEPLKQMLCRLGCELNISVWRDCWPQVKHPLRPVVPSSEPSAVSMTEHLAPHAGTPSDSVCNVEPGALPHPNSDNATVRAAGSDSTDPVSSQAMTCKAFVDQLRRKRFGIGIQLTEEAAEYSREQRKMLQQAAQRLSEELYSAKSHFVLELLQNADDSTFPPDVAPTVEFVLEVKCISIFTNEVMSLVHCSHMCRPTWDDLRTILHVCTALLLACYVCIS